MPQACVTRTCCQELALCLHHCQRLKVFESEFSRRWAKIFVIIGDSSMQLYGQASAHYHRPSAVSIAEDAFNF